MKGITVKEALYVLGEYQVSLLGGRGGLNRMITSVSVFELAEWDQVSWLCGGELILSTLNMFSCTEEILAALAAFNKHHTAAVLVHPGSKARTELDPAIISQADAWELPILTVQRDVAYATIMGCVYGHILNKQAVQLARSQEINKALTNILISGGKVESIVQMLSNTLKKPVAIFDEVDKIIAHSPYAAWGQRVVDALIREREETYGQAAAKAPALNQENLFHRELEIDHALYQLTFYKVFFNHDYLGCIMTGDQTERVEDELDIGLELDGLYHAATAWSLIEMTARAASESQEKQLQAFFTDLLNDNFETEDALNIRAHHFGVSTAGRYNVAVIDIDEFEQYCLKNRKKGEIYIQKIKTDLGRIIKWSFAKLHAKTTILPVSDCFVVICDANRRNVKTYYQELAALCRHIQQEVVRKIEGITVTIGIGSRQATLSSLARSYEEAKKAIKIGAKIFGPNRTYFYEDMGIYSILVAKSPQELQDNYLYELEKIVRLFNVSDHKDNSLLETLEAYLDCQGSLQNTARVLDIHPNTVLYRIQKAKTVLDPSYFTNCDKLLQLHVLLKMRKML